MTFFNQTVISLMSDPLFSLFPPGLLCFGAGSQVHDESEEMNLQRAALSLQFLPLEVY